MPKEKFSFCRAVYLGIKDYVCDTRHDFYVGRVTKMYGDLFYEPICGNQPLCPILSWKEGPLVFYIKQRLTTLKKRKQNAKNKKNHKRST